MKEENVVKYLIIFLLLFLFLPIIKMFIFKLFGIHGCMFHQCNCKMY